MKRVIWHPYDDILASASYDDTIKLYCEELDDWSCVTTLKGHNSTVWGIDFNSTGQHIVSCSDDKTLKFWSREPNASGKKDKETKFCASAAISDNHSRPIYDVSWSKVSDLVATACGDNCVRVFRTNTDSSDLPDVPNFELSVKECEAHQGDVNAVSWNPKVGGVLASCGDDGLVKIWHYDI